MTIERRAVGTKKEPGKADRIAADFAAMIRSGELAPGAQLPSVSELRAEHGVAYQTARDVYRTLEREGLVYTRHGKGSFVSPIVNKINRDGTSRYQPTARSAGQARGAFAAELQRLGLVHRHDSSPTVIARQRPPEEIASIFGLSADADAVSRLRVMRAGRLDAAVDPDEGFPVQIAISWFPAEIAAGTVLEQQDTGPGGSKSRLADLGYTQTRITESLEVRLPMDSGVGGLDESAALGISDDQPVFVLQHVAVTSAGSPVEVAIHVMPTSIWRLTYSWDIST
ncbi:GntR family transcriptional regulator [Streptomyces sp. NPDC001493]